MEKYVLQNIEVATDLLHEDVKQASVGEKGAAWSNPRNIANWADWLTFDIMGDLVFGKAFGMLDHPQNRFAVDLVSSAAHRHLIVSSPSPPPCPHLLDESDIEQVRHPSNNPQLPPRQSILPQNSRESHPILVLLQIPSHMAHEARLRRRQEGFLLLPLERPRLRDGSRLQFR